jgi:hemoglobin
MMQKHFRLNAQVRMRKEHFMRWLVLFEREVDSQFAGPKAEETKERARTIAVSMFSRMDRAFLPLTHQ